MVLVNYILTTILLLLFSNVVFAETEPLVLDNTQFVNNPTETSLLSDEVLNEFKNQSNFTETERISEDNLKKVENQSLSVVPSIILEDNSNLNSDEFLEITPINEINNNESKSFSYYILGSVLSLIILALILFFYNKRKGEIKNE